MVESLGNSFLKTLFECGSVKCILQVKSILLSFLLESEKLNVHFLDSLSGSLPITCSCVDVEGKSEKDTLFLRFLAVAIGKKAMRKMRQHKISLSSVQLSSVPLRDSSNFMEMNERDSTKDLPILCLKYLCKH